MPLAGMPVSEHVSMYMQFGLDLFQEENAVELGRQLNNGRITGE